MLTTSIGGDDLALIGGAVGLSQSGQMVAQSATRERYGTVRLGSAYQTSNDGEFAVGIGVSSNPGKKGQLCFNLAEIQPLPDGRGFSEEPGALRYRIKPGTSSAEGNLQYELFVMTGSYSQLGVVKMLHSLSGYTEEQINACRGTHAASVGLVLDGLDDFCGSFFTTHRMQGYFDSWARGQDLAQQIWDDAEKRGALFENVVGIVLADDTFKNQLDAITQEWLTGKVTDEFIVGLFKSDILEKVKEISDAHWDDDLESAINTITESEVKKQLPDAMSEFISTPDNVEVIAESVREKVQESVSEDAQAEALKYAKNVFNGSQTIQLGGIQTTFPDHVDVRINAIATEKLNAFESRISALTQSLSRMRSGSVVEEEIGTVQASGAKLPGCDNYDLVEIRTNMGSTFVFDVWRIKRAFSENRSWSWVDVWGQHDDDVEYQGAQIRLTQGWAFHEIAAYQSAFPMRVIGLKYSF